MTYKETQQKALTLPWKVGTCHVGEKCWCRTIVLEQPLIDNEGEILTHICSDGAIDKEFAEHIVKLHNNSLKSIGFIKIDSIELKNLKNP